MVAVACSFCGKLSEGLHFGGDGNIPPPGVCDDCAQEFGRRAIVKRSARVKAAFDKAEKAALEAED